MTHGRALQPDGHGAFTSIFFEHHVSLSYDVMSSAVTADTGVVDSPNGQGLSDQLP